MKKKQLDGGVDRIQIISPNEARRLMAEEKRTGKPTPIVIPSDTIKKTPRAKKPTK